MTYKNKTNKLSISEKMYNANNNRKELQKILSNWFNQDFDEMTAKTKEDLEKIISKLGRAISEAMASKLISDTYGTQLVYSNIWFRATKGEVKGIDLCHQKDQTYFIIEVKYTDSYPSQNLTNAKKQLQSRFKRERIDQLEAIVRRLKISENKELRVKFDQYYQNKQDFKHEELDFVVPMATIISKKKHEPQPVSWMHIFSIYINEEGY